MRRTRCVRPVLSPRSAFVGFRFPSAVIAGHAFVQNLRRGHYKLAIDAPPKLRVAVAFDELAQAA